MLFNLRNLYDRASVNTCLKPHSSELFSVMRRGCLTEMPVRLHLENSSMSTGKEIACQSHSASGSWLYLAHGKRLLATPISEWHEKEQRKLTLSTFFKIFCWEFYLFLHFHSSCLSDFFSTVMVSACQIINCSLNTSLSFILHVRKCDTATLSKLQE